MWGGVGGVWSSLVWSGLVWSGAVRCGAVRCGAVRCGVLCCVVSSCVVLLCVVLCCVCVCVFEGTLFRFLEIQTPRNFWAFWVMGTIGGKLGVLVRTAGKLVRRPASNVLLAVWEDI